MVNEEHENPGCPIHAVLSSVPAELKLKATYSTKIEKIIHSASKSNAEIAIILDFLVFDSSLSDIIPKIILMIIEAMETRATCIKSKKKVEAYRLTTQGTTYYKKGIWWLLRELLDLQDKGSGYMHSLSSRYASFGLSEDIVMGRGTGKPLDLVMPSLPQIEDFIMGTMFKNIESSNTKIEPSTGKFVMSFEFDFEQLSKELIRLQNLEKEEKK